MKQISLKYRIALTMFALTGVMLAALLWQVQRLQDDAISAAQASDETVIMDVLGELSRFALIKSEYSDLEHYFTMVRRNPHVMKIIVADAADRIVMSTDMGLLGLSLPVLQNSEATRWRTRKLTNAAGPQGLIAVEFSNAELLAARKRTRTWAGAVALVSMTFIALVSVIMGGALTRRLAVLSRASKRIGDGDLSTRIDLPGSDEVSELGRTFDAMARKIESAREDLKVSELRFTSAFEHAPIGMALVGLDERFIQVNQSLCDILGYPREKLLTMTAPDITHPDDRAAEEAHKAEAHTEGRSDFQMVKRYLHAGGHVVWGQLSVSIVTDSQGDPQYFIGQLEDITERRKLEQQLLHAQKMEAVGQLAGGIAHDFNNILTAIIGYGNIALMKFPDDDPARSPVEHILSAADRAAGLTRSLLAFSRKQTIHPQPVSVNSIIDRVRGLLRHVIVEDIELRTVLTEQDQTVFADSSQIEQALLNLATNARDAMPKGGQLTITTALSRIDDEYIRHHGYGKTGEYVSISVTDTGEGMDEHTRRRVFEPFFTTKEVGKGTGLGLAMVYGSVKQHDGYINVYSEPGRGTTFTLYLPVLHAAAASPAFGPSPAVPKRGGETVLLAEDDPFVRNMTRSVLEEFGYRVIEAVDGGKALEQLSRYRDEIDVLIVDVVMPKKNGKEVFEEAKRLHPGIRVLFTSGYPAHIIREKGELEEGLSFIAKPAAPHDLLNKLREVLDQ